MPRLRDRLPPANSLIAFEAVARHQSFTRAADELRVTQAAISRQIRLIEGHLGVRLFKRLYRAIELTPEGQALKNAVAFGLEHIARGVDEIKSQQDGADITISCSVTFASYWLMARIAKFRAEFPDVDVRLVATAKMRDLAVTGIDFAVRYGRGDWPDLTADLMFGNEVFPACAPRYLARHLECHGRLETCSDLANATLLHLTKFDRNWVTWETWFKHFGRTETPTSKGLFFDNYMILIHAAVRGEGVALCGRRLAEDLIENGELVRPLDAALQSDSSFYLLRPENRPLKPHTARFRDWLLAQARGSAGRSADVVAL
ncbi:MAG: transcriptional regulator GcvA [Alphaproteobacteria bacterium]|nr:transcriptional regulator GcvA [Alphaproteobacteria bacterium]